MLTFKESVHPDGAPRTIALTDLDIEPLGYEELASANLHDGLSIPLNFQRARIVESNVDGISANTHAHIKMRLESRFTGKAIGLVQGGWLPSALAAMRNNAVVLPDRNIISEIAARFESGRCASDQPDFLDLLADLPVRINPLLFALEGNSRAFPDPVAARAQLEEVYIRIRHALPSATLMLGPQSLQGLLGLIEDTRDGMSRKQVLLRRLAPRLASPVARRKMDARWVEALAEADKLGVPRRSLVMLAVLSTIANPQGHCAAKRLLKFHADYSDSDAYSALSDLRALEVLLHCLALFPDYNIQFCTADRNLALFWAGLGASEISRHGTGIRFSITPHEVVLPRDFAERWAVEAGPLALETFVASRERSGDESAERS